MMFKPGQGKLKKQASGALEKKEQAYAQWCHVTKQWFFSVGGPTSLLGGGGADTWGACLLFLKLCLHQNLIPPSPR